MDCVGKIASHEGMIVNGELVRAWKEPVVISFKVSDPSA
jgi:hypothetical protein